MVQKAEPPHPAHSIRVIGAPKRVKDASLENQRRSEPLRVEVVDNAIIPPAVPRKIKIFDESSDWYFEGWKAGVYDQGRALCQLSKLDRVHTDVTAPYDEDELAKFAYRDIGGEAVYGGMLYYHFGHFLLETTNRLWWPIRESFEGPIVFQCVVPGGDIPVFAARFFALLGFANRIISIGRTGCRFDRVIVPERSYVVRMSWHDRFRVPFLTAGANAEKRWRPTLPTYDGAGLYLSRTRYDYRRSLGERRLEKAFAGNGFTIAHAETLPLEEQILLARRHSTIAGIQGSACHNILFADDPKEAVYICRDYEVNQNFFMIDAMMKNRSTYIYSGSAREALTTRSDRELIRQHYQQDVRLDLQKIFWALEQPGVLGKGWSGDSGPR